MIEITTKMTRQLASDLISGINKAPLATKIEIENAGEDSIYVTLSNERLEWLVQDCFIAGLYSGLERLNPANLAPNQEI